MGDKTAIAWTDHSWNPWRGCHKTSLGCQNCYMFAEQKRYGADPAVVVRAAESTFRSPLKRTWKAGDKVFTCSWSDFFIEEADVWRDDAWKIIRSRPDLTFQVLTKRIERWRECWPLVKVPGHVSQNEGDGKTWERFPNVWLGVSVENQEAADQRIPELLKVPAVVRFLSCEPLLGPVSLVDIQTKSQWAGKAEPSKLNCLGGYTYSRRERFVLNGITEEKGEMAYVDTECEPIHWVIVGGESGPQARPCNVEWVRALVQQCKARTACFTKQLGARPVDQGVQLDWPEGVSFRRDPDFGNGARVLLKDAKGGDPDEWPEDLRVRQFPIACAYHPI